MADDAAEAWNVLEILLTECLRRLDPAEKMTWQRRQEEFSPLILEKLEALANRARINSPVRFHQSPFNSNTVVSLWCPWTIECIYVDKQLDVWDERIRTTLEKWIPWKHFYDAGGESDLRIRNHDLWPPSGNGWEERTAIRESECQSFLDSRDCKALSSLFSASPRAFVFALGSWKKQFDSVFEEIPENRTWSHALRNEMPEAALFEVREVLRLISEAHARVKRESDVANFDLSISTTLKDTFRTMLLYHSEKFNVRNLWGPNVRPFFVSDCQAFETTLMKRWLTELAHSTDRIPAGQIPALNDSRHRESDTAAGSETASEEPTTAADAPKADETIALGVHNTGSAIETKTDERPLGMTEHSRQDHEKPTWLPNNRTLSFNGQIVRQFSPQTRKAVLDIVSSFEECGWPNRIDDPLSPPDAEKTKLALRTINKRIRDLRFRKDGDGIKWEVIPNSR